MTLISTIDKLDEDARGSTPPADDDCRINEVDQFETSRDFLRPTYRGEAKALRLGRSVQVLMASLPVLLLAACDDPLQGRVQENNRPLRAVIGWASVMPAMAEPAGLLKMLGSIGNRLYSQTSDRVGSPVDHYRERLRARRDGQRQSRGERRRSRGRSDLLPHRGDYIIEVSNFSSSRFIAAQGTLTIDMVNDCDDWTLQEKLDLELQDQERQSYHSSLLYRGTEKASSNQFVFAYSRDHLGDREDFIGDARPAGDGSTVRFMEPKTVDLVLGRDVTYPISHFREVLASAKRQRNSEEATVFDGGNVVAYRAVTNIGQPLRSVDENPRVVAARSMLEKNSADRMPAGRTWPVTINYFPLDDAYAPAVFTRDFLLHESGVILGLHFDYGDLQMQATLANLDILEPESCTDESWR